MPSVMVTINDKNYRMACDDGQEDHLISLAKIFDSHVEGLKESFGEIGDQRLTVMAGIMVTDELEEQKKKIENLENEIEALKAKRDETIGEKQGIEAEIAKSITEAAEKLEALGEKLKVPLEAK